MTSSFKCLRPILAWKSTTYDSAVIESDVVLFRGLSGMPDYVKGRKEEKAGLGTTAFLSFVQLVGKLTAAAG
jgi:hypothetical protein